MRKIFLDCGAHCGCSRKKFKQEIDHLNEYEIFSFEPDPGFNKYCPELINKAVWNESCVNKFYKFSLCGGSSLSKIRADLLEPKLPIRREVIRVECIDLNDFIVTRFEPHDYIIAKFDVEGAEYTILPHLIELGGISYINELYIEWHNHRLGIPKEIDENIKSQLMGLGIKLGDWNAMQSEYCIGKVL